MGPHSYSGALRPQQSFLLYVTLALRNSIEYFNASDDSLHLAKYYNKVVDTLVGKEDYVRNISVRGAPYDFRYLPTDANLLSKLAGLVEHTYAINGNKKVIIVAHSLGNLVTLSLLQVRKST